MEGGGRGRGVSWVHSGGEGGGESEPRSHSLPLCEPSPPLLLPPPGFRVRDH